MSRFFTTGSDSESESSVSGDELVTKPVGGNYSKPILLSEDEEDTKRVVRSAKDKRFEELTNLIKTIRNAMKIRDVTKCLEEFELLGKAYGKAKSIVDKEGVPRFYVRILADLEDYLNELWEDKEGKKKMNKNNAKALSTLRQKIRKYNRDYETHIANYKQNPEQSDEDEEKKSRDSEGSTSSSSEEEEDEDGVSAAAFLKKKDAGGESRSRYLKKMEAEEEEEEESDSEEDWGSSDSDTDSESDEDEGKYTSLASKFLKKYGGGAGRGGAWQGGAATPKLWLRPDRDEDKKGGEKKREEKAKKKHDRKSRKYEEEEEDNEGGEWEKVKGGVPLVKEKPKMFAKGTEINHAVVVKKLNEILQARGKKGTDRAAQIELLQLLVSIANENGLGVALEVKIKFNIIASLYDYNPNLATYMKPEMWQKCLGCIEELLDILFAHPEIFIGENIVEESENLANPEQVGGAGEGGAGEGGAILYNRTMVQLGICAFREGLIKDAHNALLDIQSSGRAKELLGQGLLLRSLQERNPEQEKVEKRRQVPFHMHVNLELLECVYLVAAMLLEIPYMAAHEFDARRRMISKQFHHQLRVGERQPLLGPPESMREHVVAASKAMKMGDWRTCHRFVVNEKMNGKVWDLFPEADKVRAMLVRKIQEESLRTYLFTYSSVYDSISMEILADMFELDLPTVHSIISKMIINEELMASLDQPTQTVMMHRTEPTAQQNLALQLAEKLGNLVENNERVFDHKQGSYGGYFRGPPRPAPRPRAPPRALAPHPSPLFSTPTDQKDGYRKGDGGYLRRGGYRQQERGSNY
ncbi:EIF3C factor, partial [Haliaeetus albicilla]|nr:EIF3C factor [Haliaeetus albicilla]